MEFKYFAVFDADGVPVAFYNEAVHGCKTKHIFNVKNLDDASVLPIVEEIEIPNEDCLIPENAIYISEQEWLNYIDQKHIDN